jgi:oligoribonuclease (3'-5' exoribonuclease)
LREELNLQWFPSGVMKTMHKASDDSDENIFTLTYYSESKVHIGDSDM